MSLLSSDINELDTKTFEITPKFLEEDGWTDACHPIYTMYQKQFVKNCFKVRIDIVKNPAVCGGGWEATVMYKDLLSSIDKKYKMVCTRVIKTIKDCEWLMGEDIRIVMDRLAIKHQRMLEK